MTQYNIVTTVIALCAGGAIVWLIRRRRLGAGQTALWLGAVGCLLVFGIFPSLLDRMGVLLGVHYPPVLLIVVTLCILLVKLLTMDIGLTRHETAIRVLTQKLAACEAEIKALKAERSKQPPTDDDR